MKNLIIYLLSTILTINLISCDKKADEGQNGNQLYLTDKGDSLETGFWTYLTGQNGVSSNGNYSDGFREDKWTYMTDQDTATITWAIFKKDSLKLNIPDYITLTAEEEPTVFFGNIKNTDEHCYITLLRYDLEEVKSSVYGYLYQYIESLEKGSSETLRSKEIKKYTFKNIEVFLIKVELEQTRKYQAISYVFVINNILYDLTYRDFFEEVDNIDLEVFNDILYSFESSDFDLFNINNKHFIKEENVLIKIQPES